ncbi:conserved hypothetical protein [Aliivibrio fischeri MJ11]|uniref:SMODS and SLOG-associating 2TM effector domain-containing protein n=1 Tax=Aliivibrio fischeri (strain MJ11) TaxID=388396 RepID=B5EUA9_ALIFM|nr:hypothetical protein [Aliivibrio fischeri]ACH64273.1 conserved hypothetical protein [Aliivibrio fischeri MJ11]
MSIEMENSRIDESVSKFIIYVENYRKNLNKQGVWLFLATIGCMGLEPTWLKIMALFVTLIIFFSNLLIEFEGEGRHLTYDEAMNQIKQKIELMSCENDKSYWFTCLDNIKKHRLGFFITFYKSYIYLISFVFYLICLILVMFEVALN